MAGEYHRWSLHNERHRRQGVLVPRPFNGRPVFLETADFTDWSRIVQKQVQRLGQLTLNAVDGSAAWRLQTDPDNGDNNFRLLGGDGTAEGAAGAWLGGLRALLWRATDYQCLMYGAFSDSDAFMIHHRVTSVAVNQLVDTAAKFTAGALIGYYVHIEGAGDFEITGNNSTTLTLAGFDPAGYPELGAHPYFWMALQAPVADMDQDVYLDVHLEDWGVAEDPTLNHNPGGTQVEAMRRLVLVQRVWVRQNPDVAEMPIEPYRDAMQTQHYVLKIGHLSRLAGNDAVLVDNPGAADREENASSGAELEHARDLAYVCVGNAEMARRVAAGQNAHDDLAARLLRDQTVITVGPTGTQYGAHFTGPEGLQAALACNAAGPRTVFLRNGGYDLTGQIVVREGWTLIGESKSAIILLDEAVDGAPSMIIHRHARVANATLLRYAGASGATCAVQLVGHAAQLDRVYVYDELADVPAIEIPDVEAQAAGGAGLVDCEIIKVNGPGVLFSGRNAFGLGATTSVAGPFPGLAPDADVASHGTRHGDYGTHLTRCRLDAISDTYTESRAAIQILGGDGVRIADCETRATGIPSLRVKAALAGGGSPAAWNSRGASLVQGCTFLTEPADPLAAANSAGVCLIAGRISMTDCRVETLDEGLVQQPSALIDIRPDEALLLDLHIDGLYVRASGPAAININIPSSNVSVAVLTNVDIVPTSSATGSSTALRATAGASRGSVKLQSVRVQASAAMARGFDVDEGVEFHDCHVDGTAVTQAELVDGDLPEGVKAAFHIRTDTVTGYAPRLQQCSVTNHGGTAFRVHAAIEDPPAAVLEHCIVKGSERTLIAFVTQGFGRAILRDCEARDTRGACVSNETVDPGAIQVDGGRFENPGVAYLDDVGVFPALESGAFALAWGACLRGVASVVGGCELVHGSVGVVPAEGADISGCNSREALVGLLVEAANVTVPAMFVAASKRTGAYIRNAARFSGHLVIHEPATFGLFIDDAPGFDAQVDMRATRKNSTAARVVRCTGDWRLSGQIRSQQDADVRPLLIDSCADGRVMDFSVLNRPQHAVQVTNSTSVMFDRGRYDCGSATESSLVFGVEAAKVTTCEARHVDLTYGMTAHTSGSVRLEGLDTKLRGIAVHPDASSRVEIFGSTVHATPRVDRVDVASGIYVGGVDGARVDELACVVANCKVLRWHQVGQVLDANVVAPAVGRSGGIRLQMGGPNTQAIVTGCEIWGESASRKSGIFVGDLNQLPDAQLDPDPDQHRYGVERLEICGNVLRHEDGAAYNGGAGPQIVAVIRNGANLAHTIAGNSFDHVTGAAGAIYCEMNEADTIARVDFKGNQARRAALDDYTLVPYVQQSEYVLLDGGIASDVESYTWSIEDGLGRHNQAISTKWPLIASLDPDMLEYMSITVQRTNSVWTNRTDYLPADPVA